MQKYEYTIIDIKVVGHPQEEILKHLNEMGQQGWQLVAAVEGYNVTTLFFMREIEEK